MNLLYITRYNTDNIFPELITNLVIIASLNDVCKVLESDIMEKSKTVTGCNLPAGTKIFITYMQGNPYAEIALPQS